MLDFVVENDRKMCLRLADHDPIKAADIETYLTLKEIAEAFALKLHDNWVEETDEEKQNGR